MPEPGIYLRSRHRSEGKEVQEPKFLPMIKYIKGGGGRNGGFRRQAFKNPLDNGGGVVGRSGGLVRVVPKRHTFDWKKSGQTIGADRGSGEN